jgi:branched-chain amino acid transport system permease protein
MSEPIERGAAEPGTPLASSASPAASADAPNRIPALVATAIRRSQPWVFCIVALILTYSAATGSLYTARLATVFCIYGALALSLNLAVRFVGQYSLGHSALFAIGAYTSAVLAERWTDTSPFLILPICVLGTACVGFVLGAVSLRIGGLYFAIFTLIFAIGLSVGLENWSSLTGGNQGILGPAFPEFSSSLSDLGDPLTWAAAVLLTVAVFITWNLRDSPAFPVLAAVRDSERLAKAFAVPTTRVKVGVFTLSAGIAGAAGWLFSFLGIVSPASFTYIFSVTILVMVLLGGLGSIVGPLLGAAFVVYFPEYVEITGDSRQLLYGGLLIFVMVVVPTGLMGVLKSGIAALVARLGPAWTPGRTLRTAPVAETVTGLHDAPDGARAASGSRDPAIVCEHVSFGYVAGSMALRDVELRVQTGTIHGLIGANGSGKSTLLNVVSGFLKPGGGRVAILDTDVHDLGVDGRARLGVRRTFQTAEILGDLTCLENCAVGMHQDISFLSVRAPLWRLDPRAGRQSRRVVDDCHAALEWAGIGQWADHTAASVPHAVQQMLQVARAYASKPRIVLFDEPAAGLTPGEVNALAERLRAMRDEGITVVIVEHLVQFMFSICDAVTVLDAGEVVESGSPTAVRQSADVRRVYLGAHVDA